MHQSAGMRMDLIELAELCMNQARECSYCNLILSQTIFQSE